MLKIEEGATVSQNVKGVRVEEGGQSVARLIYPAGYTLVGY